ncbi:hypothetical protein EF405_04560 [Cyclobacteriaceae bacterium YHN15]|nr:hypothetical protein EF405_04560 [Cyclobacteriaceae bacterium YHN15]
MEALLSSCCVIKIGIYRKRNDILQSYFYILHSKKKPIILFWKLFEFKLNLKFNNQKTSINN